MAGSSRVQDNTYLPYLSPTQMVSFLLCVTLIRKVGQKDMASVPSPAEFDVSPVVGFVPEKEPLVSKVLKTYRK